MDPRKFIFTGFAVLIPMFSFSQDATGSEFAIGIGSYFFQYQHHKGGSEAIGPSVYWWDTDVSLQVGLLMDLQPYKEYEQSQSGYGYSTKRSLMIPVLGHYRFYQKDRTRIFATIGFLVGGKYYLDENDMTQTTDAFSFLLGMGASYDVGKSIRLRLCTDFRFSQKTFNAGAMFEVVYHFGLKPHSSE